MTETGTGTVAEIEPYRGFQYRRRSFHLDAQEEARLLALCGIDPAIYSGGADPAQFITHAINEGVSNGVSANGGVNMVQKLDIRRLPRLDEEVMLEGGILDVTHAPRGRVTTSEVRYHGQDGALALISARRSLKTDPTKQADPALRGAGERPPPVFDSLDGLVRLGEVQLTPEIVQGYSLHTRNPIHTEMEAANRAGYRAPIIGGAHGVRYLTAAIWREFAPTGADLDIYFRRPLFWDDGFRILARPSGGGWDALCIEKDGKVAVEMRINALKT